METLASTVRMSSGHLMPMLGFGVYKIPDAECTDLVRHALRTGYRHIDSAVGYRNEAACAAAMRASGLPRAALFFTTKIPPLQLGYEATQRHLATSLATTGLDYFDLVLIHSPHGGAEARRATWAALREAKAAGTVRSIGVSNYGLHHLQELDGAEVDVGQWELHPWMMRPEIVDWCRRHDVVVQAWGAIARGTRFAEPVVQELAAAYGKTPAQVLLRWSLQQGFVPLVKSAQPARIEENAGVVGWALQPADVARLSTDAYAPTGWDPTQEA